MAHGYYRDLDPEEARDWLYFEKFKMKIHSTTVSHILAQGPAPARKAGLGGESREGGLSWRVGKAER